MESVVHEINMQIHFKNINVSLVVFLAWKGAAAFFDSLIEKAGQ